MRIAALLTCHERRATTLRCLDLLAAQRTDHSIVPVVVDAASTDGTAEAVRAAHPEAIVEVVGDDVYWNGGMRRAWTRALELDVDAHLWLNDDTILDDDAVARLVDALAAASPRGEPAIIVGTTRDPDTGEPTYGGVRRPSRARPLRHELVQPTHGLEACDTMNGNVVLVPQSVVDRIGILDPGYTHGMGDFDYGHRAGRAGIPRWVAPGTYGTCPKNPPPDPDEGLRDQFRRLRRPTGLPPADFARFARAWAGPAWPVYWASPYVRRVVRRLRR